MTDRRPAKDGLLFDLPLDRTPAAGTKAGPPREEPVEQPALPLAAEPDELSEEGAPGVEPPLAESATPPAGRRRYARQTGAARLRPRLAAGLTDLGVCAAVLVVLLVVLLAQGVRPAISDWPAGALFLLTFSFLYTVLPLAFWGRTPGMALIGLRAAGGDGGPLSFRQAVLTWLGLVLTVILAGLPALLALRGRTLSDLLSGSTTRRLDHPH